MFSWLNPKSDREILLMEEVTELVEHYTRISVLIHQITAIMRTHAEATKQLRDDLDFLAQQTVRISEQQNRIMAHILRDEDISIKDFSSSIH